MARISNTSAYPNIGTPVASDYLILTDKSDNLVTKTATLGDVQKLFGLDTLVAHVTVNSASLLTLGTTSVTLISAPGAGKVIDTMRVSFFVDAGGQAYDFGNQLQINSGIDIDAVEINSAADVLKSEVATTFSLTENTALTLSTASNPSQGTGTLYLNIIYRVLNVDSSF